LNTYRGELTKERNVHLPPIAKPFPLLSLPPFAFYFRHESRVDIQCHPAGSLLADKIAYNMVNQMFVSRSG